MKSFNNSSVRYRYLRDCSFFTIFVMLILFFASCASRPEPYSILEFPDEDYIFNYSKTGNLMFGEENNQYTTAVAGSIGDLFARDEGNVFVYTDTSSQNRFIFEYKDDNALYINDKIYAIEIPDDNEMIPWFKNLKGRDLSALQFIDCSSNMPQDYLPYLTELAEIKPNAGLSFDGDFADMAELLKIFKPRYIVGPTLSRKDYDMLTGLTSLEILMISLDDDSVINDQLPSMPELKQLLLPELGKIDVLTNDFLINNKQIEKVFIQKPGSIDFSIFEPLNNLKELVVLESDTIINFDLINNHKKLEVLSIIGDDLAAAPAPGRVPSPWVYDPGQVKLPSLRWMAFSSSMTQEEFNFFIDTHPGLEIVHLIANDTIKNLQALSKLSKLNGLIVADTVTDIASIKALRNLKFLSLPGDFMEDSLKIAEIQESLPGTRIAANSGLCLGSGWLLLLVPLVLILRFFTDRKNKGSRMG